MRTAILAIVLAVGLVTPALAEEPAQPRPGEPVRLDPVKQIERQRIEEREGRAGRSGFWTSRAPAKGGAYRWRMLGIGLVLMCITGGGIVLLIKRANRSNAERQAKSNANAPAAPANEQTEPATGAEDAPPRDDETQPGGAGQDAARG